MSKGLGKLGARVSERVLSLPVLCMGACVLALAIALLPLDVAALLVLGTIAAVLAVSDPLWATGLAILSVPAQELVELPGGLSLTQAALLLALVSLALDVLAHPERPLRLGWLFAPLAILLWCMALSTAFTPFSRAEALRETARWATLPLIYLLALRATEGRERTADGGPSWRVWLLVGCLLLAPAGNAVVGLAQWYFGIGPESFGIGGGRMRAYGTIGQPNSFAGYMNQGWPLAAGVALFALLWLMQNHPQMTQLTQRTWRVAGFGARSAPATTAALDGRAARQVWWAMLGAGGAAGLTLLALLVSYSRGGWVGGFAGALTLALAVMLSLPADLRPLARRVVLAGLAGVVALVLLGGGGLLPTAVTNRLGSLVGNLRLFDARGADITPANFAVVERMAHLQAGWNMLQSRPLLGVGPGNYSVVYEAPPPAGADPISVRPWYESRGHAHNYYLHIAAETGLLGLGAYLLLIGATALQAARALRAARGWAWQGMAAGGAGVVAAVAAHNLFENLHVLNMGLQLGAVWALLSVVERAQAERVQP